MDNITRKLSSIEDRNQTDRVRVWVGVEIGVRVRGLTLSSDLDLQSQVSYGHDPHTCKRSRSKVIRFKSLSENRRRTDGRIRTDVGDCRSVGRSTHSHTYTLLLGSIGLCVLVIYSFS